METVNIENRIANLVDKQDVCLLSFIDKNNFPTTRTMLNLKKRQGIKEFYLTTNAKTDKVQALRVNPKAGLYFYDRALYCGAAFTGTVEVLHDQAIKDALWQDIDTIFYENNTDPDYCVLKFTAEHARYFQDYSSTDINI